MEATLLLDLPLRGRVPSSMANTLMAGILLGGILGGVATAVVTVAESPRQ